MTDISFWNEEKIRKIHGSNMSLLADKIAELKKYQEEIIELDRDLKNKTESYKAKTKSVFGLADGEPINILEVVEMVVRVVQMK